MNEPRDAAGSQRWCAGATFVALAFLGCATAEQDAADAPHQVAVADPPALVLPAVDLTVVDRAGYDAMLAKRRGKVVLVDFWASWCAPCLEQLPHTVELAHEHGSADLAVVSLAMEDAEKAVDAERLRKLLSARGAAEITNLASQEGGGSRAMESYEIAGGALPHYKLYDRTGKLRQTFALDPSADEQFTADDVAAAVRALLAE